MKVTFADERCSQTNVARRRTSFDDESRMKDEGNVDTS